MRLFLRQTWTLALKDILITLVRHIISTPARALILPIVFIWFLAYARNLFVPPSTYGIGDGSAIRTLTNAINNAGGGRDRLVFVNNGYTGGHIAKVIENVAAPIRADGKTVQIVSKDEDLLTTCHNSIRGVSTCFAAAVFHSSPTEGSGGVWNYTLRADGALAEKIDITSSKNDQDIYVVPLQHAIDFEIASLNSTIDGSALPGATYDYPYTTISQKERQAQIRVRYMGGIIDILGVAFYIAIVGVAYQLVGMIAIERELGMAQLIDAMMPNTRRWEPQAIRLLSHHLAFDIMYLPGWIVMAIILSLGVFQKTSIGVLLVFNFLGGLQLSSFSVFLGSFFRKAQLSGIVSVIISLLLAVFAQVVTAKSGTGVVTFLSLFFPPMTYTYFIILMARWERQDVATNLVKSAPENPWVLSGIVLWIFMIIHIIVYPLLGALVERKLHGTASEGRTLAPNSEVNGVSRDVILSGFTKIFRPNWIQRRISPLFGHHHEDVVAVDNLSLTALQGNILILLGANGSGKSTTLDAISGLTKVTSGTITVNSTGGLGLCPQKNVLWDELTVKEHVRIFNRLKSTGSKDSDDAIEVLVAACDLDRKLNAQSRTLSGGQKRKLQLAMMFTGGSSTCAVDEVSSGIDPLSRRKIWDILLAERGKRTIILTTHFLDEADLLSDRIAILSRGVLKAEGSAAELKQNIGGGYRIYVNGNSEKPTMFEKSQDLLGARSEKMNDGRTVYTVPNSAEAAKVMERLENHDIHDYQVLGPTIEDVFLKLAEEVNLADKQYPDASIKSEVDEQSSDTVVNGDDQSPQLLTGRRIGMPLQALILFKKRLTIIRRNYLPHAAALVIPVIAAGLTTLFLKNVSRATCSPDQGGQISYSKTYTLSSFLDYDFKVVAGPRSKLGDTALELFTSSISGSGSGSSSDSETTNMTALRSKLHMVDTLQEFNDYISTSYANITPGGFFLGDDSSPPTFAYRGNGYNPSYASITQNFMDVLLTNISIQNQYEAFDIPWDPSSGKTLQLIVYFGLAMCAYPAFFGLYPNIERLHNVRSLHYSNGVRTFPLWLAYIIFDFMFVITISVLAIIIYSASSGMWYHPEYLFVVFFLYGFTSTLFSYVVSLFTTSSLATFAFSAGGQAGMFLLYFIAYLSVLTYAPTNKIDSMVDITHFAIATITPAGNLLRSLFVALNEFSILCRDEHVASYPGGIRLYGGPILYLIIQGALLFGVLLWWDSGSFITFWERSKFRSKDAEEADHVDEEISNDLTSVSTPTDDGLRVHHLTKTFGKNVALENVSFDVKPGQLFAMLGPNGAGKSTCISIIRGDIKPRSGEVFVENVAMNRDRAAARAHLGVCPQFDAIDQMTVLEHLRFYARIRGVPNVEHNVQEVIRAVGLQTLSNRMAAKLSGGNKRKLSLGIALMGNPSVLLLDEPSSGMDAASKRVMWKTLASVAPGRSLVLTTHSMEEADALANRVGIIAGRMLALGSSEYLRQKHGNTYHVQIVTRTAPHTDKEEMERIRAWVIDHFPSAVVEEKTWHGQMRFSVPAHHLVPAGENPPPNYKTKDISSTTISVEDNENDTKASAEVSEPSNTKPLTIASLFTLLENNKDSLDLAYYSVAQTTLDQVFLTIVGKHHVEEENYEAERQKDKKGGWKIWGRR